MKGIYSIGEVIPKVIKSLGLEKKSKQVDAMLLWKEIVGERVSEKSMPIGISRGILKISVCSSSWMNELQMMKPEIMEKVGKKVGINIIKDVRFYLGSIK
ncbi:MAG TPA: DUF721 domain-containing protein [bacterium]